MCFILEEAIQRNDTEIKENFSLQQPCSNDDDVESDLDSSVMEAVLSSSEEEYPGDLSVEQHLSAETSSSNDLSRSHSDSHHFKSSYDEILTFLGIEPGKPSKHFGFISFVSGVLFITSVFWSDIHWTAKGLQLSFGTWSIGPTTAMFWFVPLQRPTQNLTSILTHMHLLTPLFVLVMAINLSLALLVILANLTTQSLVGRICLVLAITHVLVLILPTTEPLIRSCQQYATIPFFPFCFCYCCCPKCFPRCHRFCCRRNHRDDTFG